MHALHNTMCMASLIWFSPGYKYFLQRWKCLTVMLLHNFRKELHYSHTPIIKFIIEVTTTGDHWKRQYNLTILLSLHQVFCTKCNKKYHRFCCQAHYAKIKFWIKLTFKVCVKSLPARPGSPIKPCPQEKHFIDKNYEFALQLIH